MSLKLVPNIRMIDKNRFAYPVAGADAAFIYEY